MRAIEGLAYIRSSLRRIELNIQSMMYDIEQGLEINIPPDLSQKKLPYSIRYYDPILSIIKKNVTEQTMKLFQQ